MIYVNSPYFLFLCICYFGKLQENGSSGKKAKVDFKQKCVSEC